MGKIIRLADRASWLSVCAFGLTGYVHAGPTQHVAPVQRLVPAMNTRTEYQSERLRAGQNIPAPSTQPFAGKSSPQVASVERKTGVINALYRFSPQNSIPSASTRTAGRNDAGQVPQTQPSYYSNVSPTTYAPPQLKSEEEAKPRLISRLMHPFGGAEQSKPMDMSRTSRFTGLVQTGTASWYGSDFHGGKTANGERYDMYSMTAAHRTLPFGTLIKVTNLANGNECIVRVNNRGPFRRNRILDLSKSAAHQLGMLRSGITKVKMEVLGLGG